jgi:hypothetical protein
LREIAVDNPGFLEWIIHRDFASAIKEISIKALEGEFPKQLEPSE